MPEVSPGLIHKAAGRINYHWQLSVAHYRSPVIELNPRHYPSITVMTLSGCESMCYSPPQKKQKKTAFPNHHTKFTPEFKELWLHNMCFCDFWLGFLRLTPQPCIHFMDKHNRQVLTNDSHRTNGCVRQIGESNPSNTYPELYGLNNFRRTKSLLGNKDLPSVLDSIINRLRSDSEHWLFIY